jgi:LmbE family N-acetylglucosaminyl deacetylase
MSKERIIEPAHTLPEDARVVVIVAHHDDIEFGVAGSIAQWVRDGAEVTYVIITDGGAGSNEVGVVRADLVARRKQEQLDAAKAIGVNDVRFLGYTDGELEPTIALRRELTRILREVKPYRVVCQDPETMFVGDTYINHPDHRAAGTAATYATFPSSESRPIFAELLDEGYEPHKVSELYMTLTLRPTHYQDTSATIDDKIASLRFHESQIGAGEDADNGALKWIRERNHENGEKVGVQYAEFFRVMKFDKPREDEEGL